MKPLIWTIRGNVPVEDLSYEKEWVKEGDILWFKEAWYFQDGELAKNNAHGYVQSHDLTIGLQGADIGGEQAVM